MDTRLKKSFIQVMKGFFTVYLSAVKKECDLKHVFSFLVMI